MFDFSKAKKLINRLRTDISGISLVEFALILPVILTLGLYGTEVARMATTKMKVSQIALSVADNASRLGQTENSGVTPTITEGDVESILRGSLRQGSSIDLENNARVVISSLEYDDFTDRQYIHWQRCIGEATYESRYGNDTDRNGINGDRITGLGQGSTKITADSGSAVMFVEVYYEYQSLWDNPFGSGDSVFYQEAAYLIRDDRNIEPGLVGGASGATDCN